MPRAPGVSTRCALGQRGLVVFSRHKCVSGARACRSRAFSFCLQLRLRHTRLHAPDHVEPIRVRIVHIRDIRQQRHGLDRQVEIRRRSREPVAIESLGRNARDRDRLGIHAEGAADNRRVAGNSALPRLVAHDRRNGRALHVIRIGKQPSRSGQQPERAKVVAGDKLAHHRTRLLPGSVAAHDDGPIAKSRLHGCEFFELWHVFSELLIGIRGEERIIAVVVVSVPDTAHVLVSELDQSGGSATGRFFIKTAFSRVKIAAFAPIPSASMRMAVAVNPGVLRSCRIAKRTSCSSVENIDIPHVPRKGSKLPSNLKAKGILCLSCTWKIGRDRQLSGGEGGRPKADTRPKLELVQRKRQLDAATRLTRSSPPPTWLA